MFTEILVALILGIVVYLVLLKRKTVVLKTEDGWWGVGEEPQETEDDSIGTFMVETSQEEIQVREFKQVKCVFY